MKKTKRSTKNAFSVVENIPAEKYLTFFIDGQLYALPTSQIMEIIRMQPITFFPNLPEYVKGVINLRGKIVPLIDMRLKFAKSPADYDSLTSIVIAENGSMTAGLIVDAVKDVRDVAKSRIFDAPGRERSIGARYVRSIVSLEKGSAMILDLDRVLSAGAPGDQTGGSAEPELKSAAE